MESILLKLEEKLDKQAVQITQAVTKNVTEAIDERFKTIIEENKFLKNKVSELELKIKFLEREKRKNNLVFFGADEIGKSELELVEYIKNTIEELGVPMNRQEISNIYRIGKQTNNKNRPVVVSFTTQWQKHLILKNKSKLPKSIYVKEDYSKETLEKRKQLQAQVEEEKKNGNIAYLKHDKLIVRKQKDNSREKRRREPSDSPSQETQEKAGISNFVRKITQSRTKMQKNEIITPNTINYTEKAKSDSCLNITKN